MKRVIMTLLAAAMCISAVAQDVSIDEAILKMKETSALYLKGKYTKIDATGIDQFVDVEIKKVYGFSDFSFGAVMPFFKTQLESEMPEIYSSRIAAENKRMLEYANENLTKIVAYSALVNYEGITKYHERLPFEKLFFFDWRGRLIAIRDADYLREDYTQKLAVHMESRIIKELRAQYDPLFHPYDRWVSETKNTSDGKHYFEMTWCFELYREKPMENGYQQGEFTAKYYQVHKGFLTSKSVSYIYGNYVLQNGNIEFTYNTSDVSMYLVKPEHLDEYDHEGFSSMKKNMLSFSLVNTPKLKKVIRASSNIPKQFIWDGGDKFSLSVPINDEVFEFTKQPED